MPVIKNKKGALAQMIVTIFLVTVAVYLLSSYRVNIVHPTKGVIETGNKQVLQLDKAMNK